MHALCEIGPEYLALTSATSRSVRPAAGMYQLGVLSWPVFKGNSSSGSSRQNGRNGGMVAFAIRADVDETHAVANVVNRPRSGERPHPRHDDDDSDLGKVPAAAGSPRRLHFETRPETNRLPRPAIDK